jgi:type II secretory pathway component GspD/PulD (secretin)
VVVRLRYSQAASLAKALDELFQGRGCRVIAEPMTNSLLIQADTETSKAMMSVIEKVDIEGARPPK